MFTMGQAAKEVGTSKTSIHRAIKSGKLSASRNDDGTFSIDPAELFRAYPRNGSSRHGTGTMEQTVPDSATPVTAADATVTAERAAMAAQVAALERQAAMQDERIAELKEQRDAWQRQAEQAQRLLASSQPSAQERKGLFARLFR